MDNMEKIIKIKELVKELNEHRDLYYNKATPSISDEEYDEMVDILSDLEKETGFIMSNSPTATVGYTVISKLEKAEHETPLLSLAKTKSVQEITYFQQLKAILLMLKLDGLTVELDYENGHLQMASTRGDGHVGEDITHNIPAFENVPLEIPYKKKLRISGEAFIKTNDFEEINKNLEADEEYSTPRNLAAGSVRCLDASVCSGRKVRFQAFNILEGLDEYLAISNSKKDKLEKLKEFGIEICMYYFMDTTASEEELESGIETLRIFAQSDYIPIDGIVATYDDIEYSKSLGHTGHHYNDGLAFKFEDEKYETILRKIEWNPTRKGAIAPVAIFDTVVIDGCDVSRATLNNVSFIKKLELNIGCKILVSKRNMIIPCVEENLDKEKGIAEIPEKCPCCGKPTEIRTTKKDKGKITETLCCSNKHCLASKIKKFVHFVGKPAMNIEGLSEATIEKFIQKGFLNTFSDFFHLDKYQIEIEEMDGFGEKSYQNLWDSIQKCKKLSFERFLISMDIPKVGKKASKLISAELDGDIDKFENAIEENFEFDAIMDIGATIQNSIYEWFNSIANTNSWYDLKKEVEIQLPKAATPIPASPTGSGSFSGQTIVVTGKVEGYTRSDMNDLISSLGAFAASSVTRRTNLLVVAEKPGGKKLSDAGKYGTRTMLIEDFLAAIGR